MRNAERQAIGWLGVAATVIATVVAISSLFSFSVFTTKRTPEPRKSQQLAIERLERIHPQETHHSMSAPSRHSRPTEQPTGPLTTEVAALEAQSQHNSHETAHLETSLHEVRGILLDNPQAAVSYTLLKHEVTDDQEKVGLATASLESRLDDEDKKLELIVGVLGLGFVGLITTVIVTRGK